MKYRKISKSREIQEIRRSGRRARGKYLVVWRLRATNGEAGPGAGVVSAKGFRGAVERNHARRRVRGCLQDVNEELLPGYSYLLQAGKASTGVSYQELVKETGRLINRLNSGDS